MAVAQLVSNSSRRSRVLARQISPSFRNHSILASRVLALLFGCHVFASATAADECRSCEYSRDIPPALWHAFSESLAALERFTVADAALARRLRAVAGMPPGAGGQVIGNTNLQRFIYPWQPASLLHDRSDYDTHDPADQKPEEAGSKPAQPTWLHVPDPSDDGDDRRLRVSAEEIWRKPALATQSRSSGKWYWEVRYLPGSDNHPRAALIGIIDLADVMHDALEVMTALPKDNFAGLLGGEYVQFALDLDGRALHYGINGTWISDPANAASGSPVASGASFAPAVMPSQPDLHPYLPDEFEFNFGGSNFRYPIPVGYRPYDVAATAQAAPPLKATDANLARGVHERAFSAALHELEQPLDPITEATLREAVDAWRVYRDAACRLSAKFKKSEGVAADPNCIRAFGGALLAALSPLQYWNRLSMDPPFDELPPIDFEQRPKLHYVELDRDDVPENLGRFEDGRPTASVRVTDRSAPLILFLRAHGATHWRITVERGVNVQHVFLFGQDKQVATVSGKVASIRSYSAEQDNSGKLWRVLNKGEESPASLASALEALVGIPATSMQRGCKDARCEITADQAEASRGDLQ